MESKGGIEILVSMLFNNYIFIITVQRSIFLFLYINILYSFIVCKFLSQAFLKQLNVVGQFVVRGRQL